MLMVWIYPLTVAPSVPKRMNIFPLPSLLLVEVFGVLYRNHTQNPTQAEKRQIKQICNGLKIEGDKIRLCSEITWHGACWNICGCKSHGPCPHSGQTLFNGVVFLLLSRRNHFNRIFDGIHVFPRIFRWHECLCTVKWNLFLFEREDDHPILLLCMEINMKIKLSREIAVNLIK